jgi:membrane protein
MWCSYATGFSRRNCLGSAAVPGEDDLDRARTRAERRLTAEEARAQAVERHVQAEEERVGRDAAAVLDRHPRVGRYARLGRAVLREQAAEQVGLAASGAAFWIVISAFPTAVAVVSLFGLIVSPSEVANDLGSLARAAPTSLGSLITDQLRRVATADRAGLSAGLVVSVVLAVWSASAGTYNLDRAIRDAYGLPRQRYFEARARALAGALVLVMVLGALALGASVVGGHAPGGVLATVGVPTALLVLTAGVATVYWFSLGRAVRVLEVLPGAVFAAATVVVALAAFSAYLALSTHYTAVYGAFAGAAIGMIGTYLAVYAVLLGAVLNAQLRAA